MCMKTRINLSIEPVLLEKARDKNINLSNLFETTLRENLRVFEQATLPENCRHKWSWPFSVPSGLAKECKVCGKIQRVIMESHEETMRKVDENNAKMEEMVDDEIREEDLI